MRTGPLRRAIWWATIAVHVVVAAALAGMTFPALGNVVRQSHSGYTSSVDRLFLLVVLTGIALSGAVVFGLVRWIRGSRRLLVGVDLAVLGASWTFLLVFLFSNDLPIVTAVLSPVAPILAWRAPTAGRDRDALYPRTVRRLFGRVVRVTGLTVIFGLILLIIGQLSYFGSGLLNP